MKAHLTRRYMFSASHRLHSDEMSAEQNSQVYGKCNNPYGHGHNYRVEVTVGGQVDPKLGMVCDLVDLDTFVNQEIVERYSLAAGAHTLVATYNGDSNFAALTYLP